MALQVEVFERNWLIYSGHACSGDDDGTSD
jgi:hypothetical protein